MAEFLISGPRLFNSIISRDEDDDETGNRRKGKTVREKPGAKEEFATSLSQWEWTANGWEIEFPRISTWETGRETA